MSTSVGVSETAQTVQVLVVQDWWPESNLLDPCKAGGESRLQIQALCIRVLWHPHVHCGTPASPPPLTNRNNRGDNSFNKEYLLEIRKLRKKAGHGGMCLMSAHWHLRQKDPKFEACLSYRVGPCLKTGIGRREGKYVSKLKDHGNFED